ncbi:MAG: hypothetical protein AB2L11_00970 [Syntrophobacteraceae bacterium]
MKKKTRKWIWTVFIAGVVLTAVGPCTITHKYGPYSGKVVETETGKPIEGAYVLVVYSTNLITLAGPVSEFVETRDTTTDKNGKFKIGAYRAWAFRLLHGWAEHVLVTIYKPGYGDGGYPCLITPQEHVAEKLRKLTTYEERRDAIRGRVPVGIPQDKARGLRRLIDEERKNLGLQN